MSFTDGFVVNRVFHYCSVQLTQYDCLGEPEYQRYLLSIIYDHMATHWTVKSFTQSGIIQFYQAKFTESLVNRTGENFWSLCVCINILKAKTTY